MATQTSIFIPGDSHTVSSLGATTASAEQTYAKNGLFAINANQDVTITFGISGNVPTPTATVGFRLPAGVVGQFDLGDWQNAFKVFNMAASAANVYWLELRRN